VYEITPLAKKFSPWSISKAGVAETCAAQFKHKYILKTAEQSVPSANTVGTHAHSILEFRIAGKPDAEARRLAAEKTPLTEQEREDLRTMDDAIEVFLQKWDVFCQTNRVQKVLLEAEWAFTADFKRTGFFSPDVYFRGKVDLAAVTADRDLIVVDHKSGVSKDIRVGDKFKKQLWSYAVMAIVNLDDLAGVRPGINFLQGSRYDKIQWLDYMEAARIQRLYVPWLFETLNKAAEKLVEPFPAKPKLRWPCEWCSYRPACPAYGATVKEPSGGAEI
jgi:hypothetical protein